MMRLTLGETEQYIVCTLNEKRTLGEGYYLFRFTNGTTQDVVSKIYAFTDDVSSYPDRFNKFLIATSTDFLNQLPGQWTYEVYQQESDTNTDPAGLYEVERGLLELLPATEFAFDKYDLATTYKAYNG